MQYRTAYYRLESAPRCQTTVPQPIASNMQSDPEAMDAQDSSMGKQSTMYARQPDCREEVAYAEVVAEKLATNRKSLMDGHPAASNQ